MLELFLGMVGDDLWEDLERLWVAQQSKRHPKERNGSEGEGEAKRGESDA